MPDSTIKEAITVLVTNDGMGTAEQELRHMLVKTYLQLLGEHDMLPSVICFYTEGVKLVVEGSHVLKELKVLEEKGVRLVICNTCLNYYDIVDKVLVGIVGGMADIIEAQWRADKVITI
ncbi:MAG: hypothetical protein GTO18_13005 [Anaerolineales bacterium]|nr:hypothetical protein [Anaerolineales bacterium]